MSVLSGIVEGMMTFNLPDNLCKLNIMYVTNDSIDSCRLIRLSFVLSFQLLLTHHRRVGRVSVVVGVDYRLVAGVVACKLSFKLSVIDYIIPYY